MNAIRRMLRSFISELDLHGLVPLIGVAAVYLLLQLLVVPLDRWWSWDEATYVSQVTRGVHPSMFYPWQSRGVSIIVAPMGLLGAPLVLTRIWLALMASIGLAASFTVWAPILGRRATAVAAFLFCGSWLALFYGSEAMPNLWSAILAIAASGLALRGDRRAQRIAAGLFFGMALVRVPDAVLVGGVLALTLGPLHRRWSPALAVAGGVAAGCFVWLGELLVRFGLSEGVRMVLGSQQSQRFVTVAGPLRRLEAYVGWLGSNVAPPNFRPNAWSMLWWGVVLAAAAVGAWRAPRREVRTAAAAATVFVLAYGFLAGPVIPRYMLSAFGLFTLPAAVGFVEMARIGERLRGELIRDGAGVLILTLALAQVMAARQVGQGLVGFRGTDRILGQRATTAIGIADPETCFVLIAGNAPAIGMALPCRARFYAPPSEAYAGQSSASLEAARTVFGSGGRVFYLRYWRPTDPEGFALDPLASLGRGDLFEVTGVATRRGEGMGGTS